MTRHFQPRGAWQRFRDTRNNPPEPMWVMRWAVVLTFAAVAIWSSWR